MAPSDVNDMRRPRPAEMTGGEAALDPGRKAESARVLALQVFSSARGCGEKGSYRTAAEILSEALVASNLSRRDEALATELVYSTLRRQLSLDWIVEEFSGVRVRRIDPRLLDILRLGVLQLVYMRGVPAYAAVNESVKLALAAIGKKAAGFTNSVLRKVAARASAIPFPARERGIVKHISIVHSHPAWLVRRWVERLGEEMTVSLCAADNTPPPTTARVNILKTTRERLMEKMLEEEVAVSLPEERQMIELVRCPKRFPELASFREGLFYLQDVSATIAARMLSPVRGERVLDLCSAPGGKATHIAELMGNRGLVLACDRDERKMPLLRDNIERLGTTIVRPLVADGTNIDSALKPEFDRVLVDAPCSNTGVLRRRIEARWRLRERDLRKLQQGQIDLLRSASTVLKRGGVLVYSTCSIEREENQDVVEQFLKQKGDFELQEEKAFFQKVAGGDGGYAAKMVRR